MIDTSRRQTSSTSPGSEEAGADRASARKAQLAMVAVLVVVLAAIAGLVHTKFRSGFAPTSSHPSAAPPRAQTGALSATAPPAVVKGLTQDRAVPQVSLVDENGRPTSLAAYRGRVVVMAPFLTLCGETCPYTGAALARIHQAVSDAGLGGKVAIVEVTVDPGRDTPARLRAYAHLTGATWPLLTGTAANLDAMWRFYGVYHSVTPPTSPPETDWLTGQPLTYDVAHSDGLYFLGPDGKLRIGTFGPAETTLNPSQRHVLALEGRGARPDLSNGWTVSQAIGNLEVLLHQRIPLP